MEQSTKWVVFAMAGSSALLLGALAFQYVGGLAPCELCIWQRWPHVMAIVMGCLVLFWQHSRHLETVIFGGSLLFANARLLCLLGGLATFATASVGLFHVGVEKGWWQGLASCTGTSLEGMKTADLLNTDIVVATVTRCDAVAWQMAGLSMAGWNMVLSLVLTVMWLYAAYCQPSNR